MSMDPKIKALIAAFMSIPFGLAIVGLMQEHGLFPIFGVDGWNDMKLVIGLIFGATYVVAHAIFRK